MIRGILRSVRVCTSLLNHHNVLGSIFLLKKNTIGELFPPDCDKRIDLARRQDKALLRAAATGRKKKWMGENNEKMSEENEAFGEGKKAS